MIDSPRSIFLVVSDTGSNILASCGSVDSPLEICLSLFSLVSHMSHNVAIGVSLTSFWRCFYSIVEIARECYSIFAEPAVLASGLVKSTFSFGVVPAPVDTRPCSSTRLLRKDGL